MKISIRMDDILYKQLEELAKKNDRNISDMVRVCIKSYIQKENKKEEVPNE